MRWQAVALAVVLVVGILAGRAWFPRTVTEAVDRVVWWVAKDQALGETRTVTLTVPGPERVVRVPVEVTRTVEVVREVPVERIVTVTRPVEVPVEVIRREWPQTIEVKVGGVQSGGLWYKPDHPTLTIGQVAPGVYAVGAQMPGWAIESVTTTTVVQPTQKLPGLPYHLGATFGFLDDRLYAGVTYTNRLGPGYYGVTVAYGFPGLVIGTGFTLPIR